MIARKSRPRPLKFRGGAIFLPRGVVLYSGLASARGRRPLVEVCHDPRSRNVSGVEPVDAEAVLFEQVVDLAVEMTATRDAPPQRCDAVLPARHARIRRAAVLDEYETAGGPEHAAQL